MTALSQRMMLAYDGASGNTNVAAGEPALLPRMQALKRTLGDMLFGIETETTYSCVARRHRTRPPGVAAEDASRIPALISLARCT